MDGKWKEVTRLTFKGERFRDHALDLQALNELSQFQKIVGETAKTLWRIANPDRERLPSHFEQRQRKQAVRMVRVILENSNVRVIPQTRDSFLKGLTF